MGSSRTYHHQQNLDLFQEVAVSGSSTAYRGAEGNLDQPPAVVHVDRDGYEEIRLDPRSRTSPSREGFGSRLLTSLSNAQPAAAALTRSGSVLHTRAKSLAAYVPKLNTNSNSLPSTPEKQDTASKPRPTSKLFGDFFNGESAPVQLGVPTSPTKEKDELDTEFVMEYRSGFTERPRTQRRDSAKTPTQTPMNTRKTSSSWFGRKSITPAPAAPKVLDDEMLNININNALFPHGPADPLSPQAFNDLLLNANHLLQRMQAAYKEKAEYIASFQPEMDARKEETEEAQTRSEHLKMQLEDIGRKYEEQNQVNEEIMQQLTKEKMKVHELQEQAKSTIRLVRRDTATECEDSTDDDDAQRRRKRSSGASASDSGFESDADTASLFSAGVETPRSGISNLAQPRVVVTLDHHSQPQVRYASSRDSRLSQQSTVYSTTGGKGGHKQTDSAFTAWATVERLRGENQLLRGQVEAMQNDLQGVIDYVGEVKIA